MNTINDTPTLLNTVFDFLDRDLRDTYVIMNKYDEMPYSIPSDIDINVTQNDFERLDLVITNLAKELKFIITQKIWHNFRKCAYILSPATLNTPFRLQLDFFSDFSVKNTPLLIPYNEMNKNTRKYGRFNAPAYNVEYVFLLFRRIFKNDFSIEHCQTIKAALIQDLTKIREYSAIYFGNELAYEIANKILKEDYEGLSRIRPALLKQMNKYSSRQSIGAYYFRYWFDQFKRAIYRIKYPVGMSIALLGPDGCGKSSLFEKIEYLCWGSFHGIEKKYFRPRLFKNIGHYNIFNPTEEGETNTDPHGVSKDSFLKSLIRYSFYNIDFIIGYWFHIKPKEIKKKLIVFDRYYFDYFVDLKRYKYNLPKWLPKKLTRIIPKPDLVFILDGNADVFYPRKKELPIEELKRQIIEYKNLSSVIKNSIIVDSTKPIDVVTTTMTRDILLFKGQRTAKAMGNTLGADGIPL